MSFRVDRPPVVLDASVAIASALQQRSEAPKALGRWAEEERMTLVPTTFWSEAANGLLVGNRIDPVAVRGHLEDLSALGVEAADRGLPGVIEAVELAVRHGLTVYDALYLQLALDVDGTLATLDGELADAAQREGVQLETI